VQLAFFITCLADNFMPGSGVAAVRLLEHLGHDVVFPADQTCCGQPMLNNGYDDEAARLARRMLEIFRPYEALVTTSASCAAMVREHFPALLRQRDDEHAYARDLARRTFELSELLVRVLRFDPAAAGARLAATVTVHRSCHARGLGLGEETTALLRRVEDLQVFPLDGGEDCCGFGGTFAAAYQEISGAMVQEKVARIAQTHAERVVCDDPGCAMNIAGAARRRGCTARFTTLAELLAESMGLLNAETPA
jgi:L-lactate dehydrogenase complex protein LldE